MKDINRKIIDAVIARSQKVCPDSVALIGVYGSAATGDLHPKSDLDLLILITDDDGRKLADGFILEDVGIGYDIYCTNMDMLRNDAQCHHAKLAKLMDSEIVYVKDQGVCDELMRLREQASAFLRSEERFERVDKLLSEAKAAFAEGCLQDGIGRVRMCAAEVIITLTDAVMLYHGQYFRRGTKRTFEELAPLGLDPVFEENIRKLAAGEDVSELRELMKALILYVQDHTAHKNEAAEPTAGDLRGTYEEMFSNWRNKTDEAAAACDCFSSFMNLCSLQYMIGEIAGSVRIPPADLMAEYDPRCLQNNSELFDRFLSDYEKEYEKVGLAVRRFADVDRFVADYLGGNGTDSE